MPKQPDGEQIDATVVVPKELEDLPLEPADGRSGGPMDPIVIPEGIGQPGNGENEVIDHEEIPGSPQD